MALIWFVTHPEVTADPAVPVPDWGLSEIGRRRIGAFIARPEMARVTDIACSTERKAVDCAELLAARLRLPFRQDVALGENDRSSTGYVAPPRFWEIVDLFFAQPEISVLGWERAADAQARIVAAVEAAVASRSGTGDLVIVAHGGVGTLYLCHLLDAPTSRRYGQPVAGGGCFLTVDLETRRLVTGWQDIVP
jgi:broad specificity phosphatase PhoE